MLIPISWLKEFVDIKLPLKELCSRLTEVGLGVEEIKKDKDDYILNIEITANRPDCLSIIGIAREVAAIQNTNLKLPKIPILKYPKKSFSLKIINDFELCPRYTGLIIKNVVLKESPKIIKDRLQKVGLRPINNLVDLSNYLMIETGNPIHIFDYDEILGQEMKICLSQGLEKFTSVDEISYQLPKNSLIYRDSKRVIDLCGIKGGLNSGVSAKTKNILIIVSIYNGVYIRKTAQKISVHSEASSIFERGVDAGNTIDTIKKVAKIVLENAGGEIASAIIDLKEKEFSPWTIPLNLEKVNKILGIDLKKEEVISLLKRLNLTVETCYSMSLQIKIPTYRNDLHLEEDLIEEIARIYGYNHFPQTMPNGIVPTEKNAYYKDFRPDLKIKNILKVFGFNEIYTYSLISQKDLLKINVNPKKNLKIENPISIDFQFLRPNLVSNILNGINQNQPHFEQISLFELGKIYFGENLKNYLENYQLSAATNNQEGIDLLKGFMEKLSFEFNIPLSFSPVRQVDNSAFPAIFDSSCLLEISLEKKNLGYLGKITKEINNNFSLNKDTSLLIINYSQLFTKLTTQKKYQPLPKYPAVVEDFTLVVPPGVFYTQIIEKIKSSTNLLSNIFLIGVYQNSLNLRLSFQSAKKTLTSIEVQKEREKILQSLSKINVFMVSE